MYKVELEFCGCMMPVQDIAANCGLQVRESYSSRARAQAAADKLGRALVEFGMPKVTLWVVPC